MIYIHERPRECPYCEYSGTRLEMRAHLGTFHRDRFEAHAAYQRVLDGGGTEAEARAAYNAILVPSGPGKYARGRS
jgi:hypothetical protein